ncbi:uncharacterized protein [Oscarella lobularis]|uniref:uncharacterized protein n=1 Tax=Oscarella lobularis TaxID=121494 RepID=UPI0033143944
MARATKASEWATENTTILHVSCNGHLGQLHSHLFASSVRGFCIEDENGVWRTPQGFAKTSGSQTTSSLSWTNVVEWKGAPIRRQRDSGRLPLHGNCTCPWCKFVERGKSLALERQRRDATSGGDALEIALQRREKSASSEDATLVVGDGYSFSETDRKTRELLMKLNHLNAKVEIYRKLKDGIRQISKHKRLIAAKREQRKRETAILEAKLRASKLNMKKTLEQFEAMESSSLKEDDNPKEEFKLQSTLKLLLN